MALETTDNKYKEQIELWQQVRAAIAGKYAVINIVTCLPGPQYKIYNTYSGMSQDQLRSANNCNDINTIRRQAYWARGRFFNATGRTHESLGGMVWSKDPDVLLAPKIKYLELNADGAGSGLREVVQKIVDEVTSIGRYGVLVDMPKSEGRPTQAQQESGEMAARFITYKAEQIFYTRVAGNSKSIDEIRLYETKSVKKGQFDWEDKLFVRRLVIIDGVYTNELYDDKGDLIDSTMPIANGSTLTEIPFQFFGADDNSPEYSKIPLYDLASANLGHFVLDCDNRDNLHYHGQGMTNIFTSMEPEEFDKANPGGLDVGAKGRNMLDQGDRIEVLQIEATGALPAEMLRDESRMVMLGAQVVRDVSGNQTLGAKEMEFGASTSTLKRITRNISVGVLNLINLAGMFMGESGENKYDLNTDFVTDDLSPQMLQQHILMVQGGVLPVETLYETARKVGFTKLDDEELEEKSLNDSSGITGTNEAAAIAQARLESGGE